MARPAAPRRPAPGRAAGGRGQPAAPDAWLGADEPPPGRAWPRPRCASPACSGSGTRRRRTGRWTWCPSPGSRANTIAAGLGAPGSLVTYGPAVVNPAAFRGGAHREPGLVVRAAAGAGHGPAEHRRARPASTSQAVTQLTTLILPSGLQVTSRLPQLLAGIASTIVLTRSLFTIAALAVAAGRRGGTGAGRAAAGQPARRGVRAAAGARRHQVAADAAGAGRGAGARRRGRRGRRAGRRSPDRRAGRAGRLRLDGYQARGISPLAWLSALAMLALCVAVMAWPALRAGTPDAARIRQGRQARLAGVAWAGGDLAVVALAAVAVWQLRGYSAVAHPASGVARDRSRGRRRSRARAGRGGAHPAARAAAAGQAGRQGDRPRHGGWPPPW